MAGITLGSAVAGDDSRSIAVGQKNSVIKSAANRPGNQPPGHSPFGRTVKTQTKWPAKSHRRLPTRERCGETQGETRETETGGVDAERHKARSEDGD